MFEFFEGLVMVSVLIFLFDRIVVNMCVFSLVDFFVIMGGVLIVWLNSEVSRLLLVVCVSFLIIVSLRNKLFGVLLYFLGKLILSKLRLVVL